MGVSINVACESLILPPADLLVDAMIGFGLTGPPTGIVATLMDAANNHGAPILALDVPSGVNTTTGAADGPAIRARATLTLAMPKVGLLVETAKRHQSLISGLKQSLNRQSIQYIEMIDQRVL